MKKYLRISMVIISIVTILGVTLFVVSQKKYKTYEVNSYEINVTDDINIAYEGFNTFHTLNVSDSTQKSSFSCILDVKSRPFSVIFGESSVDGSFYSNTLKRNVFYKLEKTGGVMKYNLLDERDYSIDLDAQKYLDPNLKLELYPYIKPQEREMLVYKTGKYFPLVFSLFSFDNSSCDLQFSEKVIMQLNLSEIFDKYLNLLLGAKRIAGKELTDSTVVNSEKEKKYNTINQVQFTNL